MQPIDIPTLAEKILVFMTPYWTIFLSSATKKTAEIIVERTADTVFSKAKSIWIKLKPKVFANKIAKEAVKQVANSSNNESYQTILRTMLVDILKEDKKLAKELNLLLRDEHSQQEVFQLANANSQSIALNIKGDSNTLKISANKQKTAATRNPNKKGKS